MEHEFLKFIDPRFSSRLSINGKDGSVLVEIPAGEFQMGDGQDEDSPPHPVSLDTYKIGVFTVTNRQYDSFIKETGHRLPDGAEWGYPAWRNGTYPAHLADHPVTCVSWDDAAAYCDWAGLRLPTEAQWERAARGPQSFIYPWGNEWDSQKCLNYMRKGLEATCQVYALPEGVSGYGLFNTSGNVLEWCADWYERDSYCAGVILNPTGPEEGEYKVGRGGSWGNGAAECRSACRTEYNLPGERANFRGFRVVLDK